MESYLNEIDLLLQENKKKKLKMQMIWREKKGKSEFISNKYDNFSVGYRE